ncbi:hypothetical protein [Streptomyces sp. NPDC046727]|uniref:hypothetical protein n=1 Tax=Streptomyces sp. NPDC046727 TaxID=3155373 RepID=UPI0033F4ABA4
MSSWNAMTMAERALLRRAMSGHFLAGMVQYYGAALRWAGDAEAPPSRSYTADEERALVPRLAEVALELAGRGLIEVRSTESAWYPQPADPVLSGPELRRVLTDPVHWAGSGGSGRTFWLSAPEAVRARWQAAAYPAPESGGFPRPEERTPAEEELLLCTFEASGWLTGSYGILAGPEAEWSHAERVAWVEPQIAPLLPYVEKGWIEVQYFPGTEGDYTVVPAGELVNTLADPGVWHEDDDWGVGVTCVFTDTGRGAWRN